MPGGGGGGGGGGGLGVGLLGISDGEEMISLAAEVKDRVKERVKGRAGGFCVGGLGRRHGLVLAEGWAGMAVRRLGSGLIGWGRRRRRRRRWWLFLLFLLFLLLLLPLLVLLVLLLS